MDIYNLQDVVAPSQLRFAITLTSLILRCFPYSHSDQYQTLESFFVCELVKRLGSIACHTYVILLLVVIEFQAYVHVFEC